MKNACFVLLLLAVSASTMATQDSSAEHKAFSVWNIHTRDVLILGATQNDPIAVLTPTSPIIVRRIEALSMRARFTRR
jgi:hypothetical protein